MILSALLGAGLLMVTWGIVKSLPDPYVEEEEPTCIKGVVPTVIAIGITCIVIAFAMKYSDRNTLTDNPRPDTEVSYTQGGII